MSRGFDGFDIDDSRDPQWESERYRPDRESSQGRGSGSQSGGTVRSKLESLLQRLEAHPKIYVFRFQVLCICRGRFFLFFSFRLVEIFCANIHQLSHPAERRRAGGERRPHPIEVMRVGVLFGKAIRMAWILTAGSACTSRTTES